MEAKLENSGEGRRRRRVVMVVYPFQGHINPILQLATILYFKGFSIIIAYPSDFNPPNPSNHPEFTYLPLKSDGGDTLLTAESTVVDGIKGIFTVTVAVNKVYKDPFEKCVKELMSDQLGGKGGIIGCIIYDTFMYSAQSVADKLKIPGICLRTSCVATILTIAATHSPDEDQIIGFNSPVQVPMESLLEVPELRALDFDYIDKRLKETALKEVVEVKAAIITAFTKSAAIIVNTMGFLEWAAIEKAQQYFSSPIYPIGPFHKYAENPSKSNSLLREDPSCIACLDQHPPKSVIYLSFGSLATITEEEVLETAMGLAQTKRPFLWVVRPGLISTGRDWAEIVPRDLEECLKGIGYIVDWAPQRRVLGHGSVGGFWTHCGWNSTLEGVCEGVPMICRPFFGDQFLNAKYISKVWKIGLELENKLERGSIERALREIMVGKEGEYIRKRALDLKYKADLCMKEGGSSHTYANQLVDLISSF